MQEEVVTLKKKIQELRLSVGVQHKIYILFFLHARLDSHGLRTQVLVNAHVIKVASSKLDRSHQKQKQNKTERLKNSYTNGMCGLPS